MEKKNKKKIKFKEGLFTANEKGFGFITVEGEKEDYFVPEKYTAHAFNGDFVRFIQIHHKDSFYLQKKTV